MDSPQILIVNPEQTVCCSTDPCRDLPSFFHQTFGTQHVYATNNGEGLFHRFAPPDLLVFLPSTQQSLHTFLDSFQGRWNHTALIGLFCGWLPENNTDGTNELRHLDDFISCPFQLDELKIRVQRLLGQRTSASPIRDHPSLATNRFVGESDVLRRVIAKIPLFATADATILISGETGTGKDLYARSIHYHSRRRGKPFIPINCGALPEQLFENEMFGHTKGAYTDAGSEQKGLLQEAEGGTLFLDEIDALSPAAQIKLLRFLQDHEYRPLGSPKVCKADVRILAATNANLPEKIRLKQFREDLFYRLNILSIPLPPLREHLEDIPLLAEHFAAYYAAQKKGGRIPKPTPQALQKLMAYHWPGNIREFQSVIQRAVILSEGPTLEADACDMPNFKASPGKRAGAWNQAKGRAIEQFERAFLINLLSTYQGNVSRAAKAAGKERRSFQRLLRKHGLNRASFLAGGQ